MHKIRVIMLLGLVLCQAATGISQPPANNVLVGVFDGRTPCQQLARHLEEKTSPDCIKIKWRLTLWADQSGAPSHYELIGFVYKKDAPRKGRWHIRKGTAENPDAVIYRLESDGEKPIHLLKADENILFFLDDDQRMLTGNRDFSYTLNRKT
jgi:hypothetical protein